MLSLPQHYPYYRLFKIDKVIGEGSFGKALLCRRKDDYKRCIIKLISLGHLSPKEARQTQQEASLLERLNHPNIVSFWDSFVIGPNLFIVMEFADGMI
jgi:serine/threonine protein kinase